jgi:hypothetical protein
MNPAWVKVLERHVFAWAHVEARASGCTSTRRPSATRRRT